MKWSTLILFFLMLSISECGSDKCSYDASPNLTAAELAWLSYTNNEKIAFKNELGQLDTLQNTLTTSLTAPGSKDAPCEVGYETGTEELHSLHNQYSLYITVAHYYPDNRGPGPNNANIYLGDIYYVSKFSDYPPQNNIVINGNSYNNVYIVKLDSIGCSYSPAIWQVYYTQTNGILEYNTGGGHTWVVQ